MMNIKYIVKYLIFFIPYLGFTANSRMLNNNQMAQLKFTNEGTIERISKPSISMKELNANKEQIPQVFNSNHLDKIIYATGGDISGSGNTLFYNGKRKLLDTFFMRSSEANIQLFEGTSSNLLENFNPSKTNLNTIIQPIFNRLSSLYPSLSNALLKIYTHMPFYLVAGQFRFLETSFYLDKQLEYPSDAELFTTALYIKNIGVLISRKHFFEMDEFNQAALIIHELLRGLQIQYSLQMKNSEIQSMTASLMDPYSDLTNALMNSSLQVILQKPQDVSTMKDFRILLDSVRSKYNITPYINPNSSHLSFYDLADISANISLQLLDLFIKQRSNYTNKGEIKKLDEISDFSDQFDKKVVEWRSYGVKKMHYSVLEGLIELTISLNLKPAKAFISKCNREWIESQKCADLSDKVRDLIY